MSTPSDLRIETERLILRPTAPEDFDGWAELMAHDSSRFIGGPVPREASWRGFMAMAGSWSMLGYGMFSMIDKASGKWLGRTGPWCPEGWPGTEVGWGVLPSAMGRGYAHEAAVATMDWAFDTLGWTDIIHSIAPDNAPSIALAERLGSTWRGPSKLPSPYEHFDIALWGQTREQWRARGAAG